jgi:hypothetical protein
MEIDMEKETDIETEIEKEKEPEIEILNDDWIKNFENTDKLYQDFYKENLYYTNLFFIYINKNNEIEKLKQESFLMSMPNCITREEILGIIKGATIEKDTKYSLSCLLKYNMNLETEDIHTYLKNTHKYNFFTDIKIIDNIYFDKTINMFHDLNDLIIILTEKQKNHNYTKTIKIKSKLNQN